MTLVRNHVSGMDRGGVAPLWLKNEAITPPPEEAQLPSPINNPENKRYAPAHPWNGRTRG